MQGQSSLCVCGCGLESATGQVWYKGHYRPLPTFEDRLWAKVDRNGPAPAHRPELGPCWLWKGALDSNRYGVIVYGRQRLAAHRVAYELKHGPIPAGLLVCHRCDVKLCCRDEHHFLGTYAENNLDRMRKGRGGFLKGEHNGRARLTDDMVRIARAMSAQGAQYRQIARELGAHEDAIRDAVLGVTWSHVA